MIEETLFNQPGEPGKGSKQCPHCGAKMVMYRHSLSRGLVEGLTRIVEHTPPGRAINLKHLGLTRNQWDNFQKLRYWSLVEKDGATGGKGGVWRATADGRQFVQGYLVVRRNVVTWRGTFMRYEGETVSVFSVIPNYWYRPDYAAQAEAYSL